jgi:3-oxoacyl-[acyl-carrier protein] reductase
VSLHGRVALVTGANHGIGAAVARALVARGASVVVTYLRSAVDPDSAPERYHENRMREPAALERTVAVEADLLDPSTPRRLFDAAEEAFGRVEILVNNATGWCRRDSFLDADVRRETFDTTFGVDALASGLMIGEFARRHLAAGASWGRIVGMTSESVLGFPGEVTYGAAKAAQESYTLSAARELLAHGVTANMVHPPVTDTGWVDDGLREIFQRDGARVAVPDDVAEVIAWLCSDAARMVTGNVIRML